MPVDLFNSFVEKLVSHFIRAFNRNKYRNEARQ